MSPLAQVCLVSAKFGYTDHPVYQFNCKSNEICFVINVTTINIKDLQNS